MGLNAELSGLVFAIFIGYRFSPFIWGFPAESIGPGNCASADFRFHRISMRPPARVVISKLRDVLVRKRRASGDVLSTVARPRLADFILHGPFLAKQSHEGLP